MSEAPCYSDLSSYRRDVSGLEGKKSTSLANYFKRPQRYVLLTGGARLHFNVGLEWAYLPFISRLGAGKHQILITFFCWLGKEVRCPSPVSFLYSWDLKLFFLLISSRFLLWLPLVLFECL